MNHKRATEREKNNFQFSPVLQLRALLHKRKRILLAELFSDEF